MCDVNDVFLLLTVTAADSSLLGKYQHQLTYITCLMIDKKSIIIRTGELLTRNLHLQLAGKMLTKNWSFVRSVKALSGNLCSSFVALGEQGQCIVISKAKEILWEFFFSSIVGQRKHWCAICLHLLLGKEKISVWFIYINF